MTKQNSHGGGMLQDSLIIYNKLKLVILSIFIYSLSIDNFV